ncbi:hypothetical protein ACP8Y2_07270 [Herpetosiphon llansteffanensis]
MPKWLSTLLHRLFLRGMIGAPLIVLLLCFLGFLIFSQIVDLDTLVKWQPLPLYPDHEASSAVRSETPNEQRLRFITSDQPKELIEWYDQKFNLKNRRDSTRSVQYPNPTLALVDYNLCTGMLVTLTITSSQTIQEVALVQHKHYPRNGICLP